MRVCVVGFGHAEFLGLYVHLLDETSIALLLHFLPGDQLPLQLLFLLQQLFARPHSNGQAGVIATGQHEPMKQVVESIHIPHLHVGAGAADG